MSCCQFNHVRRRPPGYNQLLRCTAITTPTENNRRVIYSRCETPWDGGVALTYLAYLFWLQHSISDSESVSVTVSVTVTESDCQTVSDTDSVSDSVSVSDTVSQLHCQSVTLSVSDTVSVTVSNTVSDSDRDSDGVSDITVSVCALCVHRTCVNCYSNVNHPAVIFAGGRNRCTGYTSLMMLSSEDVL